MNHDVQTQTQYDCAGNVSNYSGVHGDFESPLKRGEKDDDQ